MLENGGVLSHHFVSLPLSQAKVRSLENTVWNPLGGQQNPSRGHEADANSGPSGTQPAAPTQSWEPVRGQHSGLENQDSQHKLNQPTGAFPEEEESP